MPDQRCQQPLCVDSTRECLGFDTISPQHKNWNIANFVLAVQLKIKKNKSATL